MIIVDLIKNFTQEELFRIIVIFILSLLTNIIQSIGFSRITANLLASIQMKKYNVATSVFTSFIYLSIIYLGINYIYRYFQNGLLSKLYQWSKYQLIRMLLVSNNEDFSNANFTAMMTPINRISRTSFNILNDLITFYIPSILFLIVCIFYIIFQNFKIATIFIIGNLMWILFLSFKFNSVLSKNKDFEETINRTDRHLTEMLNHVDKMVSRGETYNELQVLKKKKEECISKSFDYYLFLDNNLYLVNTIVLITTVLCIGVGMNLFKEGKFNSVEFVTFFTILLMYREKILSCINILPEFIESIGRSDSFFKQFESVQENYKKINNKQYQKHDLAFETIELKDACFEFNDKIIFKDLSLKFNTNNHKIIGLTGPSGKGKSTICKMLLKLYQCNKGKVLIDDQDISNMDPIYIRKNINYINQNSKLFDRKVLENMLYACNDEKQCKENYKKIIEFPKIKKLYEGVDIENGESGPLGEKLSGGQRQIANIISGLINPGKLLILDEPTNALDKELKLELLEIIKLFKQQKQAIIIITHDKDVNSIFDEEIKI